MAVSDHLALFFISWGWLRTVVRPHHEPSQRLAVHVRSIHGYGAKKLVCRECGFSTLIKWAWPVTSDHCPLTSDQESFPWITLHRQAGDGSAHERAQEGPHQVQRWLVSRNKWTQTNPWLTNKSSTFSNCDVFCPRCNFFTFDPEQSLLHAAQHREDEKNRLGPFF